MRKNYRTIKTILATVFLLTNSCGRYKEPQVDDTEETAQISNRQCITINIEHEPSSLDPRKARSLNEVNLAKMFSEGLTRVGKNNETICAIAKSYEISEDHTKYTFHLRDCKWSNGDDLTANDFVYAWKKALSPDFLSDYAFLLYPIKNAKAVKSGDLPSSFLGIEAVDRHTLVVELETPLPFFLDLTAMPSYFPVNSRIDREVPDWAQSEFAYPSCGPFFMKSWKHNDEIVAGKNPMYWDKNAVSLEEIKMVMVVPETELQMFQNEELQWSGSPYSNIPIDAISYLMRDHKLEISPMLGTCFIRTNTEKTPLNSNLVRKALALGIDRNSIVEHVLQGGQLPATGLVPPSQGLQAEPLFADGNIEEAKQYLLQYLAEKKSTIEKFPSITLTYVASPRAHRTAQAIHDQWRKNLDIVVRLEPLESQLYYDKISRGNFELACGSWTADYNDPTNFLEVFKNKDSGINGTNWEDLDFIKGLEASYFIKDKEERRKCLGMTEKILIENMPVIPVFHYTMLHSKNQQLHGVLLQEGGSIDFKWAYLDRKEC